MRKGDIIEAQVLRVEFPNKGIVETLDEEKKILTVKNVIPGQVVRARVNKIRHGKAEAALQEVLKKSPTERDCPCPHFGSCGGCTYLSMEYEQELELKKTMVQKLLEPYTGDTFEGILASPIQYGYRNKMEFTFGDSELGGPLALGMHKRGSTYDIVSVTDCQIVDEDYRKILKCTLDYFGPMYEQQISFYHRMRKTGYLRHLLVRKAVRTGEILVDLITTTQEDHDLQPYVDALLALKLDGKMTGILHTRNDSEADAVINQGTETLYGQDFFYEELLGLRFKITPFSFFQTNSLSAEVLYRKVQDYVRQAMQDEGKAHVLYDLYCGTGTISQLMSPVAEKVVGVEIVEEAVEAAKINAASNGIDNCEFVAGDVLKTLDDLTEKPDFIILDPPRDGIHPKALPKILSYGVQNIVYVSCKPTSLARDLEVITAAGYRVEKSCCVDQFPWSTHVETVVGLQRKDM